MSTLRNDHTDQFTIASGHLNVGNGHKVYYEQWGNKKAKIPILVFHGGPGSHYKASHKRPFNPTTHQVIFFDQRGCGNSLPYGKLEYNTTENIISDTKAVLDKLNIKTVHLFGGSWGSTLALLFNIAYPKLIHTTIVRGVFLGSKEQIEYVDKGYFKNFYPEVWEKFVSSVPEVFRDNPAEYHYAALKTKDKNKVLVSSKALSDLETPLLAFEWHGYSSPIDKEQAEEFDYVPYLIYGHYLSNNCFLPTNFIMDNVKLIKNPLYIVQGRYDMVCPPISAYRLHQAAPHSKLYLTHASHSSSDPENITATKILVDQLP